MNNFSVNVRISPLLQIKPNIITHQQGAQRAAYCAPEYNVPLKLKDQIGCPFCFSNRPEKHKLGKGCSLNSIQRFQRRIKKMS